MASKSLPATRSLSISRSLTLQDAITRHLGEARHVSRRFRDLSPVERQRLFTFLNSL